MNLIASILRRPWLVALLVLVAGASPVIWVSVRLRTAAAHRDDERLRELGAAINQAIIAESFSLQTQMQTWRRFINTAPILDAAEVREQIEEDVGNHHLREVGVALWSGDQLRVRFAVMNADEQGLLEGADLAAFTPVRAVLAEEHKLGDNAVVGTSKFSVPGVGDRVISMLKLQRDDGVRGVLFVVLKPEDWMEPKHLMRQRILADGSLGPRIDLLKELPGIGEGLVAMQSLSDADYERERIAPGLSFSLSVRTPLGKLNLVITPGPNFARDSLSGDVRLIGGGGLVIASLLAVLAFVQARQRGALAAEVIARTAELSGARDDLHAALDHERDLVRMKSQFVNTVSHEFRTPLGVILSSADILTHYLDRLSTEQRAQHLRDIHDSSQQMSRMLEQVLDLGRIEAGRLAFEPKPLDLPALLQKLADESHSAGGGHVRTKLEGNLEGASADESLLRHIFLNLLSNASKYSKVDSAVELNIRRDGSVAEFSVRDHGIGIPARELPCVFEAFTRGSNVAGAPGTGLGLAIVQRCVTMHQGTIHIDSTEGQGTTITVRLPLFAEFDPTSTMHHLL